MGYGGTGTFTQASGKNSIYYFSYFYNYGPLYLGYNAGSSGTYSLSGSGQVSAGFEYVGYSGTGTFTQSGGNNNISNYNSLYSLYLGFNAGSNGMYNLSGSGLLTAGSEYVGYSGTGTFTQSGGTNNYLYGPLYLGYNAGSSGTYILSGSGQVSANNNEYVGYSGTGTFTQSGGTNSIGSYYSLGSLYLGNNAGSSGTYNLSGSGQLSAGSEYVGYSGTGTFTQSGGTNNYFYGSLYLGYNAGSSGTYNLSGNGQVSATTASTSATPARGPSRSRAGPTISPTPSISASTPAATAPTTSAAAACCRPGANTSATTRRHGLVPAERRFQRHLLPLHRQRRPLPAQRRHAPDHRQRRDLQPGRLRRHQQRATLGDRQQLHRRSLQAAPSRTSAPCP